MSLAKRSLLRAAVNRRIKFDGPYRMEKEYIALDELKVTVVKAPKVAKSDGIKMPTGTVLRVESETQIKASDRVLFIKYPSLMYRSGIINGPLLIDKHDGMASIVFHYTLTEPLDKISLGSIQIYVEGE
jgi:hypothetical protein